MLTAAICGDVFAAPSVNSILAVSHKSLILLFVTDLGDLSRLCWHLKSPTLGAWRLSPFLHIVYTSAYA